MEGVLLIKLYACKPILVRVLLWYRYPRCGVAKEMKVFMLYRYSERCFRDDLAINPPRLCEMNDKLKSSVNLKEFI
jgi:hypothetical protein